VVILWNGVVLNFKFSHPIGCFIFWWRKNNGFWSTKVRFSWNEKKSFMISAIFEKKKPFYWCWSILKIWNLNTQILFIFSYDIFRNKNSSSQISQSKVVRCSTSVISSRVNVTKQLCTINMHHLWIVRKQFSRIQIVKMLSPHQDVHLQLQWYPTPISSDFETNNLLQFTSSSLKSQFWGCNVGKFEKPW
jgi:hypothetical protein